MLARAPEVLAGRSANSDICGEVGKDRVTLSASSGWKPWSGVAAAFEPTTGHNPIGLGVVFERNRRFEMLRFFPTLDELPGASLEWKPNAQVG